MISLKKLREYMNDPMAFRLEQMIMPDGEQWCPDEWQVERILKPLDAVCDAGESQYNLFYIELPRKHDKTGIVAKEAIKEMVLGPDGQRMYAAAGDKEQAMILKECLEGFIRRNPVLKPSFEIHKDKIVVPAKDTVLRVMAADVDTAYGLGGLGSRFWFCIDEFWNCKEEFFQAFYTATGAKTNWRGILITTAGYDFSSICWKVRELCRKKESKRFYFYTVNGTQASWIDPEWVNTMRKTNPPHVYQRLIENKWTQGSGAFVTRDDLERCWDRVLKPRLAGVPQFSYVLAIDLGLTRDRTAAALGHKDYDSDLVVLDQIRVWEGNVDNPVLISDVEEYILEMAQSFKPLRVVVDPWQLKGTIERLRAKVQIEEFTFTSSSLQKLSSNLYYLLHNGLLKMFYNKPLEEELLTVNAKEASYGWRLDHKSGGYSDRAIALGMMALDIVSRPSYKPASWDKIQEACEKRGLDEKFRPITADLMDMKF